MPNIFAIKDTILEKIKRVKDFLSKILNIFSEDGNFIGEDALTKKFSIFTEKEVVRHPSLY